MINTSNEQSLPKHWEAYARAFPLTRTSLVRRWRIHELTKRLNGFRENIRKPLASRIIDSEDRFVCELMAFAEKWELN